MPPNKSNVKSEYKSKLTLDLEKLKNGKVQATKVDLTKNNMIKLAKRISVLSKDVKMYMYLFNSRRYHVLNDRTINLLMNGDIGMSATTSETAEAITDSDKEDVDLINVEQEVALSIVDKNKTRAGGSFFPYLNITVFDLSKYDIFKSVDGKNYEHNCLYLALESSGLPVIKVQGLILSLRNRHIHKCDLENVCNTLETHIELISVKTDGPSRIEHYGEDFDEQI